MNARPTLFQEGTDKGVIRVGDLAFGHPRFYEGLRLHSDAGQRRRRREAPLGFVNLHGGKRTNKMQETCLDERDCLTHAASGRTARECEAMCLKPCLNLGDGRPALDQSLCHELGDAPTNRRHGEVDCLPWAFQRMGDGVEFLLNEIGNVLLPCLFAYLLAPSWVLQQVDAKGVWVPLGAIDVACQHRVNPGIHGGCVILGAVGSAITLVACIRVEIRTRTCAGTRTRVHARTRIRDNRAQIIPQGIKPGWDGLRIARGQCRCESVTKLGRDGGPYIPSEI